MSNGVFEVLASEGTVLGDGIPELQRAVTAAKVRAKQRFAKYIDAASSDEERTARLSVIAGDLKQVCAEVAEEYDYSDIGHLQAQAMAVLGGGHPAGCDCNFCKNKGKLPGAKDDGDEDDEKMEKEASIKISCGCCGECKGEDCDCSCSDCKSHGKTASAVDVRQTVASAAEFPWERVAADVETGDTYAQERVDVASGPDASPKIDKGKSGDETGWNLKPIDVPSEKYPLEKQDPTDRADYNAADFDPSNSIRERIDADKPLQPEHNVADRTETWTGTEGQASPVTSAALAKWSVLT